MKYEYLKGSAKDFEGAPEWATIVVSGESYGRKFYLEGAEKGLKYKPVDRNFVDTINDIHIKSTLIAERRPITDPVWDGEGLPPVGVECEINNSFDWITATVMFISGFHTVIQTKFGNEYVYDTRELKFRPIPIRSPEDVARSNAIGEMERAYEELTGNPAREAEEYYDLIAAGKIKGVALESKLADLKINITTDEMWREFEKKSDMEDVYKLFRERESRRGSF